MPITIDNAGSTLQIFETKAAYLRHNSNPGYWTAQGTPTSSIDWCEHNYVISFFVAEFWNTLSNIGLVLLGLFGCYWTRKVGIEFRFTLCYICIAIIGVGSAAFHGTLTHVGQQGDETPMMFYCCAFCPCLFFLKPESEKKFGPNTFQYTCVGLLVFALGFAVLHWFYRFILFFQMLIGFCAVLSVILLRPHNKACSNKSAHRLGLHYYGGVGALSMLVWQLDVHFCRHLHALPHLPNPQFHAWWHFGCAVYTYSGCTFLTYQRQVYLGKKPILRYVLKCIPYVDFLGNDPEKVF